MGIFSSVLIFQYQYPPYSCPHNQLYLLCHKVNAEMTGSNLNEVASFLRCSTDLQLLTDMFLLQGPWESKPHFLPFMLPGAEKTELGALYLRVSRVMVDVHQGREEVESLIHIANEW